MEKDQVKSNPYSYVSSPKVEALQVGEVLYLRPLHALNAAEIDAAALREVYSRGQRLAIQRLKRSIQRLEEAEKSVLDAMSSLKEWDAAVLRSCCYTESLRNR